LHPELKPNLAEIADSWLIAVPLEFQNPLPIAQLTV